MELIARCAHRLHLLEDSATSLLLVSCTPRGAGQAYTEPFLLRFQHDMECTTFARTGRTVPPVRKGGRGRSARQSFPLLHDFHMIPTFIATMSQMAQDASATLTLISALQGVSMREGTCAPQARP